MKYVQKYIENMKKKKMQQNEHDMSQWAENKFSQTFSRLNSKTKSICIYTKIMN